MKYKLICIDMDGTLLDDKHEVSQENKEVLKEAVNKGIKVAITTGRLFTSAKYYSDIIGIKAPIIASNGAYIREKDSDKAIYQSTLTTKEAEEIIDTIGKYNLRVCYNTSDTVIHKEELKSDHAYKIMNKKLPEKDRVKFDMVEDFKKVFPKYEGNILKAICIEENDKEKLNKAKNELLSLNKYEVVSSWDNNFEVMKKNTNKGSAVKALSEILGINREEIICIGDSENDLSMINYAGLGIAMGNAMEIVKDAADYVTDTNINSGVAKALRKFI